MSVEYYVYRETPYARPQIRSGFCSESAGLLYERFPSRMEAVKHAITIVKQQQSELREGVKNHEDVVERIRKLIIKMDDFVNELEREL